MAKRIILTDTMRDLADAWLSGCDWCGDDLAIHEWVDLDSLTGETVNCDRDDRSCNCGIYGHAPTACPYRTPPRCTICHRDAHRSGWQGHDYTRYSA